MGARNKIEGSILIMILLLLVLAIFLFMSTNAIINIIGVFPALSAMWLVKVLNHIRPKNKQW